MQMQMMRPVMEDKAAAKKHWWPRYCNSMWKSVLIKITLFLWQYREKKVTPAYQYQLLYMHYYIGLL